MIPLDQCFCGWSPNKDNFISWLDEYNIKFEVVATSSSNFWIHVSDEKDRMFVMLRWS